LIRTEYTLTRHNIEDYFVPSLFRFLFICGILAAIAYGGMFALATMVEPETREMRVRVPSEKINQ